MKRYADWQVAVAKDIVTNKHPRALCRKSRHGFSVFSRNFGYRISEALTEDAAWIFSAKALKPSWKGWKP